MLEARIQPTAGQAVRTLPFPGDEPATPAPDAEPIAVFEHELADFLGGPVRIVACDGYERALEFALRFTLTGYAPEDVEVVLPVLGAQRAASVGLGLGLTVVPADVEQDSGNLASRTLAAVIGPQTRAVVVTHLFGHPATLPELLRLSEHHGLAVIEDLTEALGAAHSGTPVGTASAVAVLGGGEGHLLTADDVGAVVVPTAEAEALVRGWRDEAGATPPEQSVRLALAQLRQAPAALHTRRQAAWHLNYELRAVRGVSPMFHGRRVRHAYDRYVARLQSVLWHRSAEETAAALTSEGIPASVASGPLLHEDADVRARLGDDPRLEATRINVATQLAAELIAIPLSGTLTSQDMNDVAAAIIKIAAASDRDPRERVL